MLPADRLLCLGGISGHRLSPVPYKEATSRGSLLKGGDTSSVGMGTVGG